MFDVIHAASGDTKTMPSRIMALLSGGFRDDEAIKPYTVGRALKARLPSVWRSGKRVHDGGCAAATACLHEVESIVLDKLRQSFEAVASGVDPGVFQRRLGRVNTHDSQRSASGGVQCKPAAVTEP